MFLSGFQFRENEKKSSLRKCDGVWPVVFVCDVSSRQTSWLHVKCNPSMFQFGAFNVSFHFKLHYIPRALFKRFGKTYLINSHIFWLKQSERTERREMCYDACQRHMQINGNGFSNSKRFINCMIMAILPNNDKLARSIARHIAENCIYFTNGWLCNNTREIVIYKFIVNLAKTVYNINGLFSVKKKAICSILIFDQFAKPFWFCLLCSKS